jgi:hypothetical protein
MSISTASRRKAKTDLKPSIPAIGDPGQTASALLRLINAIEELSRLDIHGNPPPGDSAEGFDGRDEDDDHVYLWVKLPDYRGPDIDINLHGNTLMVRLEKRDRGG